MDRQPDSFFRRSTLVALGIVCLLSAGMVTAGEVRIAAAANFTATLRTLVARFEADTGHKGIVSNGSTGKLYAQILNGAPYDVFLAADRERPRRLEQAGETVAGSRFTYATGRLVLWSADAGLVDRDARVLREARYLRLAMANPRTAPYGAAARAVLERMGPGRAGAGRYVYGDSITQAYQFVASGAAPLGFVALSQVRLLPANRAGSSWLVPLDYHPSLDQQAVLLNRGADNRAAVDLLAYLRSVETQALIEDHGYAVAQFLADAGAETD